MLAIKLEQFSGPLDLLLKLIEKEELDITEISLAKITDQYIEYIQQSPQIKPEEMADFLVLAARLLLIKSKALFPYLITEEEAEDAQELERQLKIYKEFAQAAKKISRLIGKKRFMFGRQFSRRALLTGLKKFSPPKNITAKDLKQIMQEIIERLQPVQDLEEQVLEETVSIEEKIAQIQQEIKKRLNFTFSRLLNQAQNKTEIIVSFLAVLELVKQRTIIVEQSGLFGEIKINGNS
jgi:segregation and condensation protein A